MPNDFLLWFHLPYFIAGIAGGIVSALNERRPSPGELIKRIITGAFASNYFTVAFVKVVGIGTDIELCVLAAFVVGLAGRAICKNIIDKASAWTPFKGP